MQEIGNISEEIKREAIKLTQANPALTTFIQGVKIAADILFDPEEEVYKYYFCLESNEHKHSINYTIIWPSGRYHHNLLTIK